MPAEDGEQVSPLLVAADISVAGMDPMRWLESKDPIEQRLMNKIAEYWFKRRQDLDRQLAQEIIKKLAEGMKK